MSAFVDKFYDKGLKDAQAAQDQIDLILHGDGTEENPAGDTSDPLTVMAIDRAGMGLTTAISVTVSMMKELKDEAKGGANKF
jgi:hypothetical protein